MLKGKPFVKWAGGKRSIINKLISLSPSEFETYYEPFVGGGAMLFELNPKKAVINDYNKELINVYECIKDEKKFASMCNELNKHEANHSEAYYYEIRNLDRDKKRFNRLADYKRAARTIYLNKACFNGLYRVNGKNEFNVPSGKKVKVNTFDGINLEIIHSFFNSNSIKFLSTDFEEVVKDAKKGDFIYFDPPYDSDTATFNSYTKNGFDKDEQKRLSEVFKDLDKRGCYVMLSNYNTSLIKELYKGYNFNYVETQRSIGAKAKNRGLVEEVIITNYANEEGLNNQIINNANLAFDNTLKCNYNQNLMMVRKERDKMNRDFNEWLSKFKGSISDYRYYVDFEKVYNHLDNIKVELNILNSLIGSKNIEKDFENIIINYPKTLECIPILLAVRASEIYVKDGKEEYLFKFNKIVYEVDDYVKFMRKTGLFELLENHIINNLYDYVLGVEVGLDSNGRKSRGGHLMENLVESYIKKAGYEKDVNYFKEMYTKDIKNKWGVDLTSISGKKQANKRWDFVIKTSKQIYVIETNFYASNGSKLNETARSYELIANKVKEMGDVTFIWITDGGGWKKAKRNLEETFNELDTLYCIEDLDNGVLENLT